MKICGHGLRDHLRLLAPCLGLIAAVWALRLILAAAGVPIQYVRYCSVTLAAAVAVLFAVLLIHFKTFGDYANVAAGTFFLILWEQLLIVGAIAFSALTGLNNIYAAPEYSPKGMGPWPHILGHLTFGVGEGTLLGIAMGSLLLWLLRRILPAEIRAKPLA